MKRLLHRLMPLGLVAVIAVMGGCSPKTSLTVTITSNPTGGDYVDNLTCSYSGVMHVKGSLFGGTPTPITATVEWWWENGYHQNQQVVQSESYVFSASGQSGSTSLYNAPGYWLNYFWVKVSWHDQDGTARSVESSKAYCYVSDDAPRGAGGAEKNMRMLMRSTPTEE